MSEQYNPPQSYVDNVNRSDSGVSGAMIDAMSGTKPWVLLVAIVMIIVAVFMGFATIGMVGASLSGMSAYGPSAGVMLIAVFFYLTGTIVTILLAVFLLKYNGAIGRLLYSSSTKDLEDALYAQRAYWKTVGIITIVWLVLMVLGVIFSIMAPAIMMNRF